MAKPMLHARSSARKFGGVPEDYIDIHEKMDSSKASFADHRHRAIFHSSLGCYLIQDIFGIERINSDGKPYSPRDVAEQHIIEDLGRIPPVSDYLNNMTLQPWMGGPKTRNKDIKLIQEALYHG